MALLANTTVLLGKELRTEFRSRELLTTTVVFILVVIVLFSFTFDPSVGESRKFGPGLLWLSFLFAASLMLQPCFLREQNNDTLSALRLAVQLCHARRDPDLQGIRLHRSDSVFHLTVPEGWAKSYPQSAQLLRTEAVAWQKTPWTLQLHLH